MAKFVYRDIPLAREKPEPKKVLIKDVEPILREYWVLGGLRVGSVALVGWRNHMTTILQRFLIYKGLDVVRFSSIEQATEGRQPQMVIVNTDSNSGEEYNFSGKDFIGVAYTRNPAGHTLQRRGFSLIIPFPFDPNVIIYRLRDKLQQKKKLSESRSLCCELPESYFGEAN